MKKIKSLLDRLDKVQTISKDELKELKGGDYGFVFRGNFSCGWFCDPDDGDE